MTLFVVTILALPNWHFYDVTILSLSNWHFWKLTKHYQIISIKLSPYQIVIIIIKLSLPNWHYQKSARRWNNLDTRNSYSSTRKALRVAWLFKSCYLYINLICLSVCLSVCLYPINVKTAEPIWPKFFVRHLRTSGKVYEWSNLKYLSPSKFDLH